MYQFYNIAQAKAENPAKSLVNIIVEKNVVYITFGNTVVYDTDYDQALFAADEACELFDTMPSGDALAVMDWLEVA